MNTKIIEITDPQAGTIKETVVAPSAPVVEGSPMKALGLEKYRNLREAATTSEFPALLRVGLKQILFDAYNDFQTTWQEWVQSEQSDKPAEDWLNHFRPCAA
jgi:hypothetical protein